MEVLISVQQLFSDPFLSCKIFLNPTLNMPYGPFYLTGMCLIQDALGRRSDLSPFTWRRQALVGVGMFYVVVGMFAFGLAFTLGVEHIIHPDSTEPLCK